MSADTSSLASPTALGPLVDIALRALAAGERARGGPLTPGGPGAVAARVDDALAGAILPEDGDGTNALAELVEVLAWGATDPRDPRCAAHLHCPPLAIAVAADLAVSAVNPSLDSWDQAPAGVAIERHVIAELARLVGLPPRADGSITSGATESNLVGVLLARAHRGSDVVVACSAAAHFSVRQAARVAGLADDQIAIVPVDDHDRMDAGALDATLVRIAGRPAAVVATAGTTDLGAIDPLDDVIAIAARHRAWVHVDAAYGAGALLSTRLRPLLAGIGEADSIALDFHKLGWQPVPAGAVLVRDAALLEPLHRRAAYLNPTDDEATGYEGRLAQSLRTTRRADAFSIAVTMRALGRRRLGELVDRCHELARHAAARARADGRFELAADPVLTTVVFRYAADDEINAELRRRLLHDGRAVVGRTERHGRTFLKLTLLNPFATTEAVDALLDLVADAGAAVAADAAVTQAVLRCWARERSARIVGPLAAITLDSRTLTVPVHHVSATGWHRFGVPRIGDRPVPTAELVDLAARELGLAGSQRDDLVARTLASRDRIADHATSRGAASAPRVPSFLDGEQGLVAGHPFHPAAKSRDDLDGIELQHYSPELRGMFPLRWFAVERELLVTGSALPRCSDALLDDLADRPPAPSGTVAVPVHPWQAKALLARPAVSALVESGGLVDLGDGSSPWWPTSSLRTVWAPHAPLMLKLSLALRITNSRRENLRRELVLGEQAHRLLAAGVGAELAADHPRFTVVTDPAWFGVDVEGGGFETAIRQNPFKAGHPAVCVAALVDERPGWSGPVLADLLRRHDDPASAAHDWLERYIAEVVAPLAWLERTWGIVLEAHHQNTLVTLDDAGWPVGGWYRDSQGWYVTASAADRARRLVPGFGDGVDAVFDDEFVARRGAYYLGVNNLFGVVGALGAAGVADEAQLLRTARAALFRLPRSPMLDLLLTEPRLPCKGNLLTSAEGRDELAGPVEHQSVYLEIPNPFVEVRA